MHFQHQTPAWANYTVKAIFALPWNTDDWADGATRTQPEAAANLLSVMANSLSNDSPPPTSIVPTWQGGVQAEWHIDGFDLEIESNPGGNIAYSVAGPDIPEYDAAANGDLEHLAKYVRLLPS